MVMNDMLLLRILNFHLAHDHRENIVTFYQYVEVKIGQLFCTPNEPTRNRINIQL